MFEQLKRDGRGDRQNVARHHSVRTECSQISKPKPSFESRLSNLISKVHRSDMEIDIQRIKIVLGEAENYENEAF